MSEKSGLGSELGAFRLAPWFSERPWGRENLRPWYAETGKTGLVGEAWLTGPESVIETGARLGRRWLRWWLGRRSRCWVLAVGVEFPLLVKLLFPNDKLSVQVHPDDAQAQKRWGSRGGRRSAGMCWRRSRARRWRWGCGMGRRRIRCGRRLRMGRLRTGWSGCR